LDESLLKSATKQRFLDFGAKVGELLGGEKASVMNEMTKIYDLQEQLANVSTIANKQYCRIFKPVKWRIQY
jgi:hypothetical protein